MEKDREVDVPARREKLEKILPILWGSYEHMYEARKTHAQNNINFLLIMVSFLPVVSLTLHIHYDNHIFLIPIVFQVAALLILLKSFFIKGQSIPWFELRDLFQQLEKDTVNNYFIAHLKAAENDTHTHMTIVSRIVNQAVWLIIMSVLAIIMAYLWQVFSAGISLYIVTVLLLIAYTLLIFYYKDQPSFNFNTNCADFENIISEWCEQRNH